ncbi:rhodanese-like domain-containing protein [Streptomyces sp. GbtcB6]|uniref:rhodanese-like domain-containing protein n=1 Tax=Streptomyces sp. GbtcB6 TaxID=2824751 RepID=UPI0027E5A370|nr:rhodanese-like domain-containing protein [Streptomyces sp. GbtcB6]
MEDRYVVIIPIEIDDDTENEYLELWQDAADLMAAQPGFLRTYMFRTVTPESKFRLVNVAEWESVSYWAAAMEVCPMLSQQIAVVHAAGYEAIRTVLPAAEHMSGNGRGHSIVDLSPAEAHRRITAGELTLVDVRQDGEWATGRPADAVHAALSGMPTSLSDLPDGPLAFICRAGQRSSKAAEQAVSVGRSPVFNVVGGLEAWEAAGLPVVSGK